MPIVTWPEEWNLEEGWPRCVGHPLVAGAYMWERIARQLRVKNNLTLGERIESLGGPLAPRRLTITLEEIVAKVQVFYQTNGCRPQLGTSNEWVAINGWLGSRTSSLGKLCDQLGLPGGVIRGRTFEGAKQEILAFHRVHGRRPSCTKDGRQWANLREWLRKNGYPRFGTLCKELGLDGIRSERTLDEVRQDLLNHFNRTGQRPTQNTHSRHQSWLRKHEGKTVATLCGELGLPALREFKRTLEACRKAILAFFSKHQSRPTLDKKWNAVDRYLRTRGTSLRGFCDSLGLPRKANWDRNFESLTDEVSKFHQTHGVWPGQHTDNDWKNADQWLRRKGTTLSIFCRSLRSVG